MSCEKNGLRTGGLARLSAGISATGSRVGNAVGVMAGRLAQETKVAAGQAARVADAVSNGLGRSVSPVSNRVLKGVDRPATVLANLAPAIAATAACTRMRVYPLGPAQGVRPGVAVAIGLREFTDMSRNLKAVNTGMKVVRGASLGSALAGDLVAALAETPDEKRTLIQSRRSLLLGERQTKVEFSGSKLTRWLNRQDVLVSSGRVVSSQGEVIQTKNSPAWHRGTTIVRLPGGERTLTHLRSLSLPSNSYYFDRSLADAEVAGIVTGQSRPHQMSGYAGTVSAMENLAPAWAQGKRALILTRLHWPPSEPDWVAGRSDEKSESDIVSEQVAPRPSPSTGSLAPEPARQTNSKRKVLAS